jgi:hypothetical protein
VSDIGSPIYKWNLPQMPAKSVEKRDPVKASFVEEDAGKLLEQSFKLAHFFGTRQVRIFSYWRVREPEKAWRRTIFGRIRIRSRARANR